MELRAGYKQTEVGVVPESWEQYFLSDVCDRIGVGLATSVTKYYRQSGVPIVRNLNIKDGYFDGADMLYLSEDFAKANFSKAAKAFDVLTVHTGSNLGQTCVLPASFDGCQTFTTLITTPKKRILDPEFLCIHMSSAVGRGEMDRLQVGGGKGNLNTGDLKKYRVAIPPLPEQRAIATALSDVDTLLAKIDHLISKKRDLKQAAMQQLLTGQTRLPGFSGEWEVKRLGDVADIRSGGTPSTTQPAFWAGNVPWCTPTDITALNGFKYLEDTNRKISDEGLRSSSAELIPAWSIVMTSRATIGECAINRVPVSTNQGFKNFIPHGWVDVDFLYYLLLTQRQTFIGLCSGSTFLEINKAQLSSVNVNIPRNKAEQTAISTVLSDMDAELAALEARREKTRALKQGMMQALLTGRIRLVGVNLPQ